VRSRNLQPLACAQTDAESIAAAICAKAEELGAAATVVARHHAARRRQVSSSRSHGAVHALNVRARRSIVRATASGPNRGEAAALD
jgi:hypothetical protein